MSPAFPDSALTWLRAQAPTLDGVLARAARSYADGLLARPNGLFDLQQANRESYRLSQGYDLCYDRPATGLDYGLWYHPRRVNTCLSLVLPALAEEVPAQLRLYDLGAGTGAFQWAFALASLALRETGYTAPRLYVANIDSSPFMLHYLHHAWQELVVQYPALEDVTFRCDLNSWRVPANAPGEAWLCASYLFDHEDKVDQLASAFVKTVEDFGASRIVLSTSAVKWGRLGPPVTAKLEAHGYVTAQMPQSQVFSGALPTLNAVRSELQAQGVKGMTPTTRWDERSFGGCVFTQRQQSLFEASDVRPAEAQQVQLFIPAATDRRSVQLSDEQMEAARFRKQPSVVFGPAGCGKSLVLTERLREVVVDRHKYDRRLSILVTTFNRKLIQDGLKPWIDALLGETRVVCEPDKNSQDESCFNYFFRNAEGVYGRELPNIRLLHFDVLPTRIGNVHANEGRFVPNDRRLMEVVMAEHHEDLQADGRQQGIKPSLIAQLLDPSFVLDELYRICYGRGIWRAETFFTYERQGRPGKLRYNGPSRRLLWKTINLYLSYCREQRITTFLHRRMRLLRLLRSRRCAGQFDYVFVDEMQDCTEADFEIFYRLLTDQNHLFVTGDLAQAVHLGTTASIQIPRSPFAVQVRFKKDWLQGSYRLPFRVSEALVPLSSYLSTKWKKRRKKEDPHISLLSPHRGSPPGARPIVVAARSTEAMAAKIAAIYQAYGPGLGQVGFDLQEVCVLERDVSLRKALSGLGLEAESNTILRIKGLEKSCIVWSTRRPIEQEDETAEYVYTVLTRGSCLLIIALFDDTAEAFRPLLRLIQPGRVLFWDGYSAHRFLRLHEEESLPLGFEEALQDEPDELWTLARRTEILAETEMALLEEGDAADAAVSPSAAE